ncbi:MAG TPA: PAS domain-containing protein, partial [Candidatus Sulfotelmatobacter sp.]|nr:PAS domain-containing protein [Candidatus Sulfotelmatobacter sp.]
MLEYVNRLLQRRARPQVLAPHKTSVPKLTADQVHDAVLFVGRDGRIIGANQAALNMYGYSRDELLALRIHDLRSPETARLVESQMERAYRDGLQFDSVHVRKDGTHLHVEVNSNAVVLDFQPVLL